MTDTAARNQTSANPNHEANGRFAKGNCGGPGNPYARKSAALQAVVSEQDIAEIAAKLRDDAKAGDKTAIKLLFQYVIGKPTPAVEPDTLDLNELRLLQAASLPGEAVQEFVTKLPPDAALTLFRALIPEITSKFVAACADSLQPAEEASPVVEPEPALEAVPTSQPKTTPRRERPPSPNHANGVAGTVASVLSDPYDSDVPFDADAGKGRPSPNGDNGSVNSLERLQRIFAASSRAETA